MKETKAPKGYAKDTKTYKVKIESEEVSKMTVDEEPITDPVELILTKKPKGYAHEYGEGDATLKGAVYRFSYYDGQYDTAAKAESSGKATRTWYFETDASGKINGQSPVKSSRYTSDDLYKKENCQGKYWEMEEKSIPYLVLFPNVEEMRAFMESLKRDGLECVCDGGMTKALLINLEFKRFGVLPKACETSKKNNRNYTLEEFEKEIYFNFE